MKTIITTLGTLLLLCGCSKEPSSPVENISTAMVNAYIVPDMVKLMPRQEEGTDMRLMFMGENVYYKHYFNFDVLSKKYGDTGFYEPYNPIMAHGGSEIISEIITSISVVSNTDYDAQHPTGTPLDDIIYFNGQTPYYFIQNGYKVREDLPPGNSAYTSISKPLKQITDLELIMIASDDVYLTFPQPPTLNKTHTITVKCTLESGRVLTTEKMMTFP